MDDREFQHILETAKLSEKTYRFFRNLTNPKSETCGDIVSSFHKAGYKLNKSSKYYSYSVYNSLKFQRVLSAYRQNQLEKDKNREFTIFERSTEDLNFIIERSKNTGDLSTMRAAVMDRAKLHGLLIEKHQVIDPETDKAIDETRKIEAARLAESRILPEATDTIEAEFIEECTTELYNESEESAFSAENEESYRTDSLISNQPIA